MNTTISVSRIRYAYEEFDTDSWQSNGAAVFYEVSDWRMVTGAGVSHRH